MSQNLLQFINGRLNPLILGYASDNNCGCFVITDKELTKYRGLGSSSWSSWETATPNSDNRCLQAATQDQVDNETFDLVVSKEDPKYSHIQALKAKVMETLGEKYHLGYAHYIGGALPVITKEQIVTGLNIPIAHIYPGELIDNLDIAPVKSVYDCEEMPQEKLYSWLSKENDVLIDVIKRAITMLERPEEYIR